MKNNTWLVDLTSRFIYLIQCFNLFLEDLPKPLFNSFTVNLPTYHYYYYQQVSVHHHFTISHACMHASLENFGKVLKKNTRSYQRTLHLALITLFSGTISYSGTVCFSYSGTICFRYISIICFCSRTKAFTFPDEDFSFNVPNVDT